MFLSFQIASEKAKASMESVRCPGGRRSSVVVYAVYLSDAGFQQKLTSFSVFYHAFHLLRFFF